jgi:type I restriction enzyme S subunit
VTIAGDAPRPLLRADWEQTTLGELARRTEGVIQTGPFGSQLHASDYVSVGVPTVMPVNIGDNRIVEQGIARIAEADARRLSRHRLRPGDIVYSRRGDVERRGLVRDDEAGWLCGTGCLLVRVGGEGIDSTFVSYWLGEPSIRAWIVRHAVGDTMLNLNTSILSNVPVVLPPIEEQRGIAATLGALDDKIESNRRVVEFARSLGHALFVRALRGDGRIEGLRAFAASISRGAAPRYADADPSSALVLNQKCVRDGLVSTAPARRTEPRLLPGEKMARRGDILVNSTGTGTLGRVGRWSGEEVFVDSHVTVVRPNATACPPTVLAYGLLSAQPRIEALATGSTGQTELGRDRLAALSIALPTDDLISLESELLALEDRLEASRRESEALARLRDALLPELMSGRIRVPEAREAVEGAVG